MKLRQIYSRIGIALLTLAAALYCVATNGYGQKLLIDADIHAEFQQDFSHTEKSWRK
jgi:hypothetical protein